MDKKPKIRFKEFNNAWEQRKLGDEVFEIIAGGDVDKNNLQQEGLYPVIANALTNDGIVGYYNSCFRIKAPAVTVTGRGDVGHAKARKVNFIPIVRLLTILSTHDVDFLENAINTLKIVVESTGVPQLTVPQLEKYELFFPPTKEEQKKIGAFFSKLDNLITLHQREYEKLKNVKKSMLEKMFPKNNSNFPEIRFAGFTDAWKQCKLDDIVVQRIEHQKITNDASLLAFSYAEGVINPEDKKTNKRDFIMTDKYNKVFSRTEKDDIIYNPANVIHGAIHRNKLGTGVVSPIYKIFKCENVNPKFLGECLHRDKFIEEITKYIEGTVIKLRTLSPEQFLNMNIKIPTSYDEQEKIGVFLINLDSLITLHQRKFEKLKNIKKSMLEKMFPKNN